MNIKKFKIEVKMDRLDFVRKILDDNFHRRCYYCSYADFQGLVQGKVKCRLDGKIYGVKHVCEKWKLDEEFVKIIAFKTNLYKNQE